MSAYLLGTAFKASMGSVYRKMVLVRLVDSGNDDGTNIFPGIDSISEHCECSRRKVQSVLREFEAVGLIRVVKYRYGGRGKSTEYELDLPLLRSFIPEEKGVKNTRFEALLKGAPHAPIEKEKGCTPEPKGCTPEPERVHGVHPTPKDPLDLSDARETMTPEMALELIRDELEIPHGERRPAPSDLHIVGNWLFRHSFDDVIMPAIRMVLARKPAAEIGSIKYFQTAITEVEAARDRGERLPGEKPAPLDGSTLTNEQWKAICHRYRKGIAYCRDNQLSAMHMPAKYQWPANLPKPGTDGCACPVKILEAHGLARRDAA